MLALALLSIWLPSSLAVSVGLYYTHDIKCLWFSGLELQFLDLSDSG